MNYTAVAAFVYGSAFGVLIAIALPTKPEPAVVIKPDSYQQAEHFGCQEVAKVCRARMKATEIKQWTTNSKHGCTKRN